MPTQPLDPHAAAPSPQGRGTEDVPAGAMAPEYTRAERIRFLVGGSTLALLAVLFRDRVFLPWVGRLDARQPAYWDGFFVGIPGLLTLVVLATLGRRGWRILHQGQVPLRGEKVWRPTPIRTGSAARRIGLAHLVAVLMPLGLLVWGSFQARRFAGYAARANPLGPRR